MDDVVNDLISWVADLGAGWLLLVAFVLGLAESAIGLDLVVPGEVGMVLVGAAGDRADASPPALISAGAVGGFAGDSLSYLIGRRLGRLALCRWDWVRRRMEPKVERAERYLAERGGWTITGARWVGALRAVVPFVAGMSRMPYRRFVAWDALGIVPWFVVVVSLGWFFGDTIADVVERFSLAISVTVVAGIVAWFAWRRFGRSHDAEPTADADKVELGS